MVKYIVVPSKVPWLKSRFPVEISLMLNLNPECTGRVVTD
jgi:hypothetical protein